MQKILEEEEGGEEERGGGREASLSSFPLACVCVCSLYSTGGLLFRGGPLWSPLLSLPHGRLRLQNHVAGTLCTAAASRQPPPAAAATASPPPDD